MQKTKREEEEGNQAVQRPHQYLSAIPFIRIKGREIKRDEKEDGRLRWLYLKRGGS